MVRKAYWKLATRARLMRKRQLPALKRYLRAEHGPRAISDHSPPPTRRLLLLTWEFPPQVTGGVYRPLSFARYAAASGWQAQVVCGPAPSVPGQNGLELTARLPPNVEVHHCGTDAGAHPWPLPAIDGGIVNALSLFDLATTVASSGPPGVILASGPPFHVFVAARWLARHIGWPLALDYRDEWTEAPFDFVDKRDPNRHWEERCLAAADLVLFTTASQLAHAMDRFPEQIPARRAVIHNGWEPADFAAVDEQLRRPAHGPTTMAYLGNLGAMAAPDAFLETLAAAVAARPALRGTLRVRFIGHKTPAALEALGRFPYPEILEVRAPVPKTEACRMMREVDALLLLNPPTLERYIQGKLYEYVASGTPILLFGDGGEMGEIVTGLRAGHALVPGNATGMADALEALAAPRPQDMTARTSWLNSRHREALAQSLFAELDALLAARAQHRPR